MNKKQLIFLVCSVLLIEYNSYLFYLSNFTTHSVCGKVIDKKQPDVINIHKHSSNIRIEEYLYVKYDSGELVKESVSSETYYQFNIGDGICFQKDLKNSSVITDIIGIVGMACNGLIVIILIMFLPVAIWGFLGGKTLKETFE